MRNQKQVIDASDRVIQTIILKRQEENLRDLENALPAKLRRRLAPEELYHSATYNRCFEAVRKALGNDPEAEQALFELDETVSAMVEDHCQISRTLAISYARLVPSRL